jgi:two-component system, cell cycle sensor histidine kinase and response regulator CckA
MKPLKVLILEDRPDDAELVLCELHKAGYDPQHEQVETEEAFRSRLNNQLDIILADYHLPQYDALHALQHLKEIGLDIPFIVVTGAVGEEKAVECIKAGATDYLLKNSLARLAHAVERALEQTRIQREKKQAEQQLHLLTRALEAAANGVLITARNGAILWVNPAFTAMTGFTREEAMGHNPRLLKSGQQDAAFYRKMWETILAGRVWQGELTNRHKNGGLFTEEITITPLRAPSGEISHFIAIKQDVTVRHRMEEAMKESQERYRVLFTEMMNGFALLETSGDEPAPVHLCFLAINPAFERLTGLQAESVLQKPIVEALPGIDPAWIGILHRVATTGKPEHFEQYIHILKKHLEVTAFSPKHKQCAIVCVDITKRKQAEETLQQNRNFLQTMIDHLPVAVFAKSAEDGRFVLWNKTSEQLFGLSAGEILGTTDYNLFSKDQASDFRQKEQNAFRDHRIEDTPDDIVNSIHLGRRVLHTIKVPVYDDKDKPLYLLGISEDVTTQRNLEVRLLQAQKLETVGRLAGGVAHDFNNILQVIRGYSTLALKGLSENDPLREYLQEIQAAEEKAASLTHQLLAFSRRQILQMKVLNLNTIVSEMQKLLCRLIGEDVELSTSLAPDLGCVKADPLQMEQVIMNLAVNARDAMPRGGRLRIETANAQLDPGPVTEQLDVMPGPYIILTVSDTGLGMDMETLNHLFEPFFTTKEKYKGTGLGLSMVYGIIKQSGGNILVESELERGTAFRIYLPRVSEMAAPSVAQSAPQPTRRGTETILLVEDEPGVRKLIAEILKTSGYHVLMASSGREALTIAERHAGTIDLLITDVIMPDLNGREVADRLRDLRPGLLVLFVTGFTSETILRHGDPESFKPVIRKPFSPETLSLKIREILNASNCSSARDPKQEQRKQSLPSAGHKA